MEESELTDVIYWYIANIYYKDWSSFDVWLFIISNFTKSAMDDRTIFTADGLGLWGFNATFSYIAAVSLLEETGVLRENHWPVASHRQT
jgi:hypothetical protein